MDDGIIIKKEFMRHAIKEAELAFRSGEVPVGAVVVCGSEIVARAHNLVEASKDASAHAELLALRSAAVRMKKRRLTDCVLYVTLEPCPMCMGALLNFRIGAVCFGAYDPEAGCAISRCELGRIANADIPCVGGIMENECAALLAGFFDRLRRG